MFNIATTQAAERPMEETRMARHTDREFLDDLIEEFDLSPTQKISTLLSHLDDHEENDEGEEEEESDEED
jgi:hypothetical protein